MRVSKDGPSRQKPADSVGFSDPNPTGFKPRLISPSRLAWEGLAATEPSNASRSDGAATAALVARDGSS